VFVLFSLAAVAADTFELLDTFARALQPLLSVWSLPGEAAFAIVMAAVRKDGILLLGPLALSPLQVLLAAYLASTLTPCLVTLWMVARSRSNTLAIKIAGRQAAASVAFTTLLAAAIAPFE
jgi:ferrous iron transport protein B